MKDVHYLISKGIPEDEAFEDARQNIGLSKEMATWVWSRVTGTIRKSLLLQTSS